MKGPKPNKVQRKTDQDERVGDLTGKEPKTKLFRGLIPLSASNLLDDLKREDASARGLNQFDSKKSSFRTVKTGKQH